MSDLEIPRFRPLAPWWGPDLQTLRNTLAPPDAGLDRWPARRVELPTDDASGDILVGQHQAPEAAAPGSLVVLLHGLGGCEDSVYMQRSAAHWLSRGHPVLRLNLRGAGPSRATCREQYHAGRTGDLAAALRALDAAERERGLLLVGYSLGGNLLLKFLAEQGAEHPVRAAAAVSAPIDLEASSRQIMAPRNALYQRHLLARMRREALASGAAVEPAEARAIREARSIREFDDRVVAPRGGFAGASDYYARNSAVGFLDGIRVPTLLVHALDDPWIPAHAYTGRDWSRTPALVPLLARGGGHVGFHARDAAPAWHDRCIARFFARC